jgi:hypothetical protein
MDTIKLTIAQSKTVGIASNKSLYSCGMKTKLRKWTGVYISYAFIYLSQNKTCREVDPVFFTFFSPLWHFKRELSRKAIS